jgi:TetR/AcrR family transcriptional regulator
MAYEAKQLLILEAALRRFGHFGIAKTTMAEIAKDLSFSKALLYYYYPDKFSLYAASLSYVIENQFDQTEKQLAGFDNAKEAMFYLLDKRIEFVSQHYNLLEFSAGAAKKQPKVMSEVFESAQRYQEKLVQFVLQKGIDAGQLKPINDIEEISKIVIFSLEGLRFTVLKNAEKPLFPTAEEFQNILRLQKRMISVFMDGLAVHCV